MPREKKKSGREEERKSSGKGGLDRAGNNGVIFHTNVSPLYSLQSTTTTYSISTIYLQYIILYS